MQNEQLIYSYDLLGLPPGTNLEQTHRAYLEQLDVWNPNAIDEDANPALLAEVKRRRQAIDEAHRCIVEHYETAAVHDTGALPMEGVNLDSSNDGASTVEALTDAAMEAPPESLSPETEVYAPEALPRAVQPSSGWVGGPTKEALPPRLPNRPQAANPQASNPQASTFVQSTEQMQPGFGPMADSLEDDDDDVPLMSRNSRVAPSYGGAMPSAEAEAPSAAVFQLLRWNKPAGRLILMIPALWAAFLASGGAPSWKILAIIVLGSITTSAAGCAVNDLWDQKFDAQVTRTQNRPLASGRMSRSSAIVVLVICCLLSIFLALQLNGISIQLCVAAGIIILLYPAAKRVLPVPQMVLAIAWGFAVLIGWSAVTGSLGLPTFLLWLATVLWTLGFDTVYAMADQEDDRRIGLNSSALFFAERTPDAVGLFFAGTAVFMLALGVNQSLTWPFWLALVLATLGWLQQHRNLSHSQFRPTTRLYNDVFTQNVWLGLLLLAGMILGQRYG